MGVEVIDDWSDAYGAAIQPSCLCCTAHGRGETCLIGRCGTPPVRGVLSTSSLRERTVGGRCRNSLRDGLHRVVIAWPGGNTGE